MGADDGEGALMFYRLFRRICCRLGRHRWHRDKKVMLTVAGLSTGVYLCRDCDSYRWNGDVVKVRRG